MKCDDSPYCFSAVRQQEVESYGFARSDSLSDAAGPAIHVIRVPHLLSRSSRGAGGGKNAAILLLKCRRIFRYR